VKEPIKYRNKVPFFYDKTPSEMRCDPYERYDPMVVRQTLIHLSSNLLGGYPYQRILDYFRKHLPKRNLDTVLEIGCGVGKMIGEIAIACPEVNCYGIDFSYQMARRSREVWIDGMSLSMDYGRFGFGSDHLIDTHTLDNLDFGLAKCEALPFEDATQDIVLSSFLLDRLDDPVKGLREMMRVVRPHGKIIIVSPLNYQSIHHWTDLYPAVKLKDKLVALGLKILDWQDQMQVSEPMDANGNTINWKCVAT